MQRHDLHARSRDEVSDAADDARAAHDERRQREVGGPAKRQEVLGRLSSDARQLSRVAASQLDAHDVGVLREHEDVLRAEVQPRRRPREVVDEHRDGRGVGDRPEVVEERLRRDQPLVVAGWQYQRVVAAGLRGILAQADGLARRGGARADDQWHRGIICVEGAARGCCDGVALLAIQMHGLAVAALHD